MKKRITNSPGANVPNVRFSIHRQTVKPLPPTYRQPIKKLSHASKYPFLRARLRRGR